MALNAYPHEGLRQPLHGLPAKRIDNHGILKVTISAGVDSGSKGDPTKLMDGTYKGESAEYAGVKQEKLSVKRNNKIELDEEDDKIIQNVFQNQNEELHELKINSILFDLIGKALGLKEKKPLNEKKKTLKKINYRIKKLITKHQKDNCINIKTENETPSIYHQETISLNEDMSVVECSQDNKNSNTFEEVMKDAYFQDNLNISNSNHIEIDTNAMDANINQLFNIVNKLTNNNLNQNTNLETGSLEYHTDITKNTFSKDIEHDLSVKHIEKDDMSLIVAIDDSIDKPPFKHMINFDKTELSPKTKQSKTSTSNYNLNQSLESDNTCLDMMEVQIPVEARYKDQENCVEKDAVEDFLNSELKEKTKTSQSNNNLNKNLESDNACIDMMEVENVEARFGAQENDGAEKDADEDFLNSEQNFLDLESSDIYDNVENADENDMVYHLPNFSDTGQTMTWTREEYKKILNTRTGRLIAYNKAYGKNVPISEKENALTYHDLVRRVIGECSVYVHNKDDYFPKKKSSRLIKIYAYCKYKTCKKFIFISQFPINSTEEIIFKIFQDMPNIHHPNPMVSQVRAQERIRMKQDLRVMTSKDFRRKQIDAICADAVNFKKYKDLKQCASVNTITKMVGEARNDQRKHPDPWQSLVLMSEEPDSIIAWLDRKPVSIGLINKRMVYTIYKAVKKQGPLRIKFDASGSAWANPVITDEKRFLMYSLITRIQCGSQKESIPFIICEFFSSAHSTVNIHINLLKVIDFIQRYTTLPLHKLFKSVVIDFSMAEMNACVKAFNGKSIVEYLIACDKLMEIKENKFSEPVPMVCVRLCSSHVSKVMCADVDTFIQDKNDPDRCNIKSVLLSLFDCTQISQVYAILCLLWKYLLSTQQQEKIEAYKALKNYLKNREEDFFKLGKHEEWSDEPDKPEEEDDCQTKEQFKTIYEMSPNYQKAYVDFKTIVLDKYADIEQFKIDNGSTYEFIMKVLKKYITYIALITPILTFEHLYDDPEKNAIANRGNNGLIEAHHKDTKADIRHNFIRVGNPKIRVDDHITEIFLKDVNSKMDEFDLMIPRSRATKNIGTSSKKIIKGKRSQYTPPVLSNNKSIVRTIQPVNNNDMMVKMNISDIRKTEESFKKPSMSREHEKGSKRKNKKIRRELFAEQKMQEYYNTKIEKRDIYTSTPGVAKLPIEENNDVLGVASTPLQTMSIRKTNNILVQFSNISAIPVNDESTKSAKEVLPTIQEESINRPNPELQDHNDQAPLKSNVTEETKETKLKKPENSVSVECVGFSSAQSGYRGSETVLSNGLLSDINYYYLERTSRCDKITIVTFGRESLKVEECKTLYQKNSTDWVSSFVIDYSLKVLSSLYKFPATLIMCSLGPYFFELKHDITTKRLESLSKNIISSDVTLCPIIHNSHFTLAVMDNKNNTFYYMDSFQHKNKSLGKVMLEKLRNTLAKFKTQSKVIQKLYDRSLDWKATHIEVNCQNDSFHCGVHVINNAVCLFQQQQAYVSAEFNPVQYRKDLMRILIEQSDYAVNMCPFCAQKDDSYMLVDESSRFCATKSTLNNSVINWLRCNCCTRWWHLDCAIEVDDKMLDIEKVKLTPFFCIMCIEYNEYKKTIKSDKSN